MRSRNDVEHLERDAEPFESFARRFHFSPRRLEAALNIGVRLCRAIEGLHHDGRAHGSLANESVFFEKDGSPIVTDPVLGEEAAKKSDPRDDVRALGLLLCRLYTGKPELVINDYTLMMLAKAKVPRQLLRVLWQAIHDDPGMRFPDAATLGRALREVPLPDYQRTVQVRALPDNVGPSDGMPAWLRNTALVVGVVGLIALASWFLGKGEVPTALSTAQQATQSPPKPVRLPSGVTYYDITLGSGSLVGSTDRITMRFISQQSEVFPLNDHDVQSMLNGLHRMRSVEHVAARLGEPRTREGIPGMRIGGLRVIGLQNSLMPEENRINWQRNTGEPLSEKGWSVTLVAVLETMGNSGSGVSITDLRTGSGEVLQEGDTSHIRFRTLRISHENHMYKDWNGEADVSLLLSPEGTQVPAVWQSLLGMREGSLRRIVIGPPASDQLKGIRGGQAFKLPSGTVWVYEIEALSTLPEGRSRVGVSIDVGSPLVGARVMQVVGEPARLAGLEPGDLIKEINGEAVGSGRHGMRLLRLQEPQIPVRVRVSRGGADLELTVVPDEDPAPERGEVVAEQSALWIGGDAIIPSADPIPSPP